MSFVYVKESKGKSHPKTKAITNTGYQGLDRIHVNTKMPKKKTKKESSIAGIYNGKL